MCDLRSSKQIGLKRLKLFLKRIKSFVFDYRFSSSFCGTQGLKKCLLPVLVLSLSSCSLDQKPLQDDFHPVDEVVLLHRDHAGKLVLDPTNQIKNTLPSSILRLKKNQKPIESASDINLEVLSVCHADSVSRTHAFSSSLQTDLMVADLLHPDFLIDLSRHLDEEWRCDFQFKAQNPIGSWQKFELKQVRLFLSPHRLKPSWVDIESVGLFSFDQNQQWQKVAGSYSDQASLLTELHLKKNGQIIEVHDDVNLQIDSKCEQDAIEHKKSQTISLRGRLSLADILAPFFTFNPSDANSRKWLCAVKLKIENPTTGFSQSLELDNFWFEPGPNKGLAFKDSSGRAQSFNAQSIDAIPIDQLKDLELVANQDLIKAELRCLEGSLQLPVQDGRRFHLSQLNMPKEDRPRFVVESPVQLCRIFLTTQQTRREAHRQERRFIQIEFSALFEVDFDPSKQSLSTLSAELFQPQYQSRSERIGLKEFSFAEFEIRNHFAQARQYQIQQPSTDRTITITPFLARPWTQATRNVVGRKGPEINREIKIWAAIDTSSFELIDFNRLNDLKLEPNQSIKIRLTFDFETGCFFHNFNNSTNPATNESTEEDGYFVSWSGLELREQAKSKHRGSVLVGQTRLSLPTSFVISRNPGRQNPISFSPEWVANNFNGGGFHPLSYLCEMPVPKKRPQASGVSIPDCGMPVRAGGHCP